MSEFRAYDFRRAFPPNPAEALDPVQQLSTAFELDRMSLPVVESDGFDMRKPLKRPRETGGGILPARETAPKRLQIGISRS